MFLFLVSGTFLFNHCPQSRQAKKWAKSVDFHLGVSKNRGTPKWMVKIMENPTKMDDLGIPLFLETPISKFLVAQPCSPPLMPRKRRYDASFASRVFQATSRPQIFVGGGIFWNRSFKDFLVKDDSAPLGFFFR